MTDISHTEVLRAPPRVAKPTPQVAKPTARVTTDVSEVNFEGRLGPLCISREAAESLKRVCKAFRKREQDIRRDALDFYLAAQDLGFREEENRRRQQFLGGQIMGNKSNGTT